MLDYTDPDGFSITMRRTEEDGIDVVDIITTNPADQRGLRGSSECRVPVKLFMEAVADLPGGVTDVMAIVGLWWAGINDGHELGADDLVEMLRGQGFRLPSLDDNESKAARYEVMSKAVYGTRRQDEEAFGSCPGREVNPNTCRCPCYGCKHNCGAHNPGAGRD